MTRFLNGYTDKSVRAEQYAVPGIDEEEDYGDLDDDDVDGYDGFSDFDDEDDISQDQNLFGPDSSGTLENGDTSETRRQRAVSESALNGFETGDDNRRDHHNQLERKRRASIKTSYNDLREVIPSLRGSKASRAVILQRAVECIEELVKINRDHTVCVETLKRQNDALETKVQDLQRYIQRLDGEEAATVSCRSSYSACVSTSGNGTLRLVSGSITPAGNLASGSSSVPLYRLLPHDAVDKPGASHCGLSNRSSTGIVISNASFSRARASPGQLATTAFASGHSGMNALSAAVSLVASSNSAFSSTSSTGSNCDAPQSSSQRSSPGCLSSSSSTTSSSNRCCAHTRDQSEERSILVEFPSSVDVESSETNGTDSTGGSTMSGSSTLHTSTEPRTSSPPSILLTVPVRPSAVCTQTRTLNKSSSSDPETAVKLSDLSKRRRLS